MADDVRVRGIIRLKLQRGLLPASSPPDGIWAGRGADELCSACGERVTKSQMLYEWDGAGGRMNMHLRCYELWDDERHRTTGDGRG